MRCYCAAGSAQASAALLASRRAPQQQFAGRAHELARVLEILPEVQHAFAYGSGIFVQPGLYTPSGGVQGPMLDFMLAVNNPEEWHDKNIARNSSHYSSLSWLGGSAVTCNAERLGAGVHFNAKVPWGSQMIKYGVIRKEALCRDLLLWDTLYVAGRLQKPVLTIAEDPQVAGASLRNQRAALVASLLLLPEHFTQQDLGRMIVGLSYLGDIRMGIAEDSSKVERIASGSADGLRDIYTPLLEDAAAASSFGIRRVDEVRWRRDPVSGSSCELLAQLPQTVRSKLAERVGMGAEAGCSAPMEVAEAAFASGKHQRLLRSSIASIVGPSSRGQAVAGIFMAGATRSAWYVWQKLRKKWSG